MSWVIGIGNGLIWRRGGGAAALPAPVNVSAVVDSDTQITVSWDAVIGADSYKVYYGTDGVVFGSSVTSATNSKAVMGLTANTKYYFYVVAVRDSIESVASDMVSESTITLPNQINNLGLWVYPDDIAGNDGDEISSYTSKDAGANIFTGAATKRPLLKKGTNGINSHNVMLFDGSNDILVCSSAFLTATEGVVWAVVKYTYALKTGQDILASSDEAVAFTRTISFQGLWDTSTPYIRLYQRNADTAVSNYGDNNIQDLNAYRLRWQSDGSAISLFVNGRQQILNVGTNNGDWFGDTSARDNVCIGGAKATTETNFLKGAVAEIIVYERNLNSSEIAKVEKYLDYRYGKLSVLGVGDSITHGLYAVNYEATWLNIVASTVGKFASICSGINSTPLQNSTQNQVAVIGGAVTNNGRDTVAKRITDYSPEYVLILYGIVDVMFNDVGFSVANYQNDLGEVVDLLTASGISAQKIVIGSPPYMNDYAQASPYDGGSLVKHTAYIAAAAVVAVTKGTKYIDVYQWMADNGAGALLSADGLHPNPAGHAQIAAAFLSVL